MTSDKFNEVIKAINLILKDANEAFDKITDYYREQVKEKPILILREVEVQNMTFEKHQSVYVLTKTSHNKNKVVPENLYEWEYAFPNRCPLRKENF